MGKYTISGWYRDRCIIASPFFATCTIKLPNSSIPWCYADQDIKRHRPETNIRSVSAAEKSHVLHNSDCFLTSRICCNISVWQESLIIKIYISSYLILFYISMLLIGCHFYCAYLGTTIKCSDLLRSAWAEWDADCCRGEPPDVVGEELHESFARCSRSWRERN